MGQRKVRSVTRAEYDFLTELLKSTREELGVSQSELGRRIGYSQPIMSAIEAGDRRLDVIELLDILAALEVAPAEFMERLWQGVRLRRGDQGEI